MAYVYNNLSPFWSISETEALRNHSYNVSEYENLWLEVKLISQFLYRRCEKRNHFFTDKDVSQDKAMWILAYNACDLIDTALFVVKTGRFTSMGYIARNIVENNDLMKLFYKDRSEKYLKSWYQGKIISNSSYRETLPKLEKSKKAIIYKALSNFSHNQFSALYTQFLHHQNGTLWHNASMRYQSTSIRSMFTSASIPWLMTSIVKDTIYTLSECGVFNDSNFRRLTKSLKDTSPEPFVIDWTKKVIDSRDNPI